MNNDIHKLIILLEEYLQKTMQPKGFLDNAVEYVLPILSMLMVILGGFWTVHTYVEGKRKESNEQILKNVYLPLLQFFLTNDTLAQIEEIKRDYKEEPLYGWERNKTVEKSDGTTKTERISVLGMTRKNLLKQLDEVDLGLAPEELVALITSYKAISYAVDNFTTEKNKAVDYRTEVEYALRVEAYKGYKKYCKKLGLQKRINQQVFTIEDDHIELNI